MTEKLLLDVPAKGLGIDNHCAAIDMAIDFAHTKFAEIFSLRTHRSLVALVTCLGFQLLGCSSPWQHDGPSSMTNTPSQADTASPSPTPSSTCHAAFEADDTGNRNFRMEVCELVNRARTAQGLEPLALESLHNGAAQKHAEDMVLQNYFSHTGLDGSSAADRMRRTGLVFSTWGENIASGQASPSAVMDSWMNSSGHRANILSPHFRRLGVGLVEKKWVQVFSN